MTSALPAMSTSQKHRDFLSEPIGEKSVFELPGIGAKLGERLESKGFKYAYVVLGQFLLINRDEELFKEWLKDICGANSKQSNDCFTALQQWTQQYIF
ncbi:unnamed protein product [Protopolystoma xenopodis]|uniref:Barrier-to-autointegration factor-like protein n=1 Tax=Protopolystoma xenopodis TaxID=117903 RepID=A0A3S5A9X8_9PLAT|nr:unnamed protein product [Protopolystoma xenopodis]